MIVFFIILAGLFLRLWNLYNLFYFAIDEEKAAYIISQIANFVHFPTVGHPSSIGFRLGPALYFLLAPFYKIFGASPITWGYLSVVTSLFSMVLIYKIGQKLGKLSGLFALILYSFSYLNILYDRRGWQLSFHSLIALIILYSFLQLKGAKEKYIFVLTAALVAASQFEVATILFIPLSLIVWKVLSIKVSKIKIGLCILIFLISQASLLIFDIRHNFLNTKYLLNYFNPTTSERIKPNLPLTGIRRVYVAHNLIPATLTRTLFTFSPPNVAIQYANCPQYLYLKQNNIPSLMKLLTIFILLIFFYQTFINWQKNGERWILRKIISIYFILLFGGIVIYTYLFQGEMAEYYLLSAFAYFFLVVSSISNFLFQNRLKFIVFLFMFFFIVTNTRNIFLSFNPYGYKNKIGAVNYTLSIIGNDPFELDSFQTCWSTGGYRYLFTLTGRQPLRSYMDQYLSEYYQPDNLVSADYKVTILTPELTGENPQGYREFKESTTQDATYKNKFGAIEVYISKL